LTTSEEKQQQQNDELKKTGKLSGHQIHVQQSDEKSSVSDVKTDGKDLWIR